GEGTQHCRTGEHRAGHAEISTMALSPPRPTLRRLWVSVPKLRHLSMFRAALGSPAKFLSNRTRDRPTSGSDAGRVVNLPPRKFRIAPPPAADPTSQCREQ